MTALRTRTIELCLILVSALLIALDYAPFGLFGLLVAALSWDQRNREGR